MSKLKIYTVTNPSKLRVRSFEGIKKRIAAEATVDLELTEAQARSLEAHGLNVELKLKAKAPKPAVASAKEN